MRKCIIIMLVTILSFLNVQSIAKGKSEEEFVLWDGVQFGDSVKQVKLKDYSVANISAKKYTSYLADGVKYPKHLVTTKVRFYDMDTSLHYYFNKSGLKEVALVFQRNYSFNNTLSFEQFENEYDKLEKHLNFVYGEKLGTDDPIYKLDIPMATGICRKKDVVYVYKDHSSIAVTYKDVRLSSWFLKYNKYNVKIDLNYVREDGASWIMLVYYMLTNKEIKKLSK